MTSPITRPKACFSSRASSGGNPFKAMCKAESKAAIASMPPSRTARAQSMDGRGKVFISQAS
jgi:hypothetical protein